MNIYLEREARLVMVFSAIEAFKRETIGLLLGYETRNEAVVRLAIPYQTARRTFTEAYLPKKEPHLIEVLPDLPTSHMEYLGGFHSHPSWGKKVYPPKPGKTDREWIIGNKKIEIIIALRDAGRSVEPRIARSGSSIVGTVGRYHYEICGYVEERGKVRKAQLTTVFDY